MGLMDKVRAQAPVLAQKTQDLARDSKVKLDQVQAKRRADAMLRSLGAAVYAERTARGTPATAADIDKLVADLSAHEAENGLNLSGEPADASAPGTPPPAGPPPAGPAGGGTADPGSTTTQV